MVATLISAGRKQPIEASKILTDDSSSCVTYEGRAASTDAATSDPVWQIKRTVQLVDSVEVLYADNGNYTQVWDDRVSLFPPAPPCPSDPGETIGSTGGEVTELSSVAAVASSIETTVLTYVVPLSRRLYMARIEFSGTNIATYKWKVNGTTRGVWRTWFGGNISDRFEFTNYPTRGVVPLEASDTLTVTVIHDRPFTGDFDARMQGTLVGI